MRMDVANSDPAERPASQAYRDAIAVDEISDALNAPRAESLPPYLTTRSLRWHVSGPLVRDGHRLLDERADEVVAATDAIAACGPHAQ